MQLWLGGSGQWMAGGRHAAAALTCRQEGRQDGGDEAADG